jgi:hypothetical protein
MSLWISSMAIARYVFHCGGSIRQCIELFKLLGFSGELDVRGGPAEASWKCLAFRAITWR